MVLILIHQEEGSESTAGKGEGGRGPDLVLVWMGLLLAGVPLLSLGETLKPSALPPKPLPRQLSPCPEAATTWHASHLTSVSRVRSGADTWSWERMGEDVHPGGLGSMSQGPRGKIPGECRGHWRVWSAKGRGWEQMQAAGIH